MYKWNIRDHSLLHSKNKEHNSTSNRFWFDIQIRWGDFDTHNIEKYCKWKFIECTTDNVSIYPSSSGMVIGFDLCYNQFSAYGNDFLNLKEIILKCCNNILKSNPALHVLRERVRKSL